MGKLHFSARYRVGLLCAAVVAVSPVATAGTVSVDVSPTTGYSVTNRSTVALPPRTTSGPVQAYNPTLGPLAGGGAYQTTSSGITITAIKNGGSASTTMSGRIRATAGAMKNGLARCLTSFRCNAGLMAGSAGIQALFSGIDWILGEGGQISRKTYPPHSELTPCSTGSMCWQLLPSNEITSNPNAVCQNGYASAGVKDISVKVVYANGHGQCQFYTSVGGPYTDGLTRNARVISTGFLPDVELPVSPPEIDSGVNSHYNPDPSDLPYISTGGLDFSGDGVDFEIIDIPSITGADSPTFIQKSDGTSVGTYSEYKFSWGGPSKQPNVDVEEKTTETTYGPSGEVTSTTTTIVNGSGTSANVPPEVPTDCAFMPTVCRFIDWFTEPDPEINQDVDFTQLIDTVDIERDFSVGASTAACPAPFVVNLSWVPSVEVSLQPFCDLADLLRPVLLAIASLFSGMIILRT